MTQKKEPIAMPEPIIGATQGPFFPWTKSSNGKVRYYRDGNKIILDIQTRSEKNGTLDLGKIDEMDAPGADMLKIIPQWGPAVKPKNLQINKNGHICILEAEAGAWYKTQVDYIV